jgi:hypothetical protein
VQVLVVCQEADACAICPRQVVEAGLDGRGGGGQHARVDGRHAHVDHEEVNRRHRRPYLQDFACRLGLALTYSFDVISDFNLV